MKVSEQCGIAASILGLIKRHNIQEKTANYTYV